MWFARDVGPIISDPLRFKRFPYRKNNHTANKNKQSNTVSCILLNILASIYRFESFTGIPIQILYIQGHFKLRNMKLHVLTTHTLSLGRL